MDSSVSPIDEIWFLRVRHHISNAVYLHVLSLSEVSTAHYHILRPPVGLLHSNPEESILARSSIITCSKESSLLARRKVQPAGYNYLRNGRTVCSLGTHSSAANFHLSLICLTTFLQRGHAGGGVVAKALRYKPAGRGFDSRYHWNFSVT
jgi:hypothetical protein